MDHELCDALRAYKQADEDGVMVLVSRQACEEAAARIRELEGALVKHGQHDRGCEFDTVTGLCGCGLYGAISRKVIERDNAAIRTATALRDLFEWCSDTVPYFGENWHGSRADNVYNRAAAALGVDLSPRAKLQSPEPGEPA